MIFSLLTIGICLLVAYVWASRGFFSSLLNMAIVLASGAVAFGVWEPVTGLLLEKVPDPAWVKDIAWGLGLLLPFALSAAILSAIVNAVVRANVKVDSVSDWVGGAVCGLIAGTVVAGVMAIGVSKMRTPLSFMGYTAVETDTSGSIVRGDSLMVPFDRLVGSMYAFLSETTLRTSTPMAHWRPHLVDEGHLLRTGPDDLLLNFGMAPNAASLVGRYTVAEQNGEAANTLVGDNKGFKDFNGDSVTAKSYIEGYVVRFEPAAVEKFGQVLVGPGHATLVLRSADDGFTMSVQPLAIWSQGRNAETPRVGRWRFDGRDVYMTTPGAASTRVMAFEFLVPRVEPRWVPIALYIKGQRFNIVDPEAGDLTPKKATAFATVAERDTAMGNVTAMLALGGGGGGSPIGNLKTDGAVTIDLARQENLQTAPIKATHQLPFGRRLDKGQKRDLILTDNEKEVAGGDSKFTPAELGGRQTDRSLIVENFQAGDGTVIVQVDVTPGETNQLSWFSQVADNASGKPMLIDTNNQSYDCIGFVYEDQGIIHIRFTPGAPITSKDQLPSMSRTRTDQKLMLIFRVTSNVRLDRYAIGEQVIATLKPPLLLNQPQMTR